MATANQAIGRTEAIGVGLEGTPGTKVAAAAWMRWKDQDLFPKVEVIEDDSAIGVVDAVSGSEIVGKTAEGTLGGPVSSKFIAYLLAGFYGSPTTSGTVGDYTHTFKMAESSIPKTLTFSSYKKVRSRQYTYGTIDALNITCEAGGWVEVSCPVKARVGTVETVTPSIVTEKLFTSKHLTAKMAANSGALGSASALKASRLELKQERPSETFHALGTSDTPEFDRAEFRVTGSVVLRYTDSQYEDNWLANTPTVMSIALANGSESLEFTLSQVRIREIEHTNSRSGTVTQTLSFAGEFNASDARTIQAVLSGSSIASLA